ncbi:hypothetical protein MHH56_13885 [Paenibacillus sp. FSL K6-3182]
MDYLEFSAAYDMIEAVFAGAGRMNRRERNGQITLSNWQVLVRGNDG